MVDRRLEQIIGFIGRYAILIVLGVCSILFMVGDYQGILLFGGAFLITILVRKFTDG